MSLLHLGLLVLPGFCAMSALFDLASVIDVSKQSLLISVAAIAFNPTAWNIVARNGTSPPRMPPGVMSNLTRSRCCAEYRNKTITRMLGGNARYGCYFLAFCIFSAGMVRDGL